MSKKLRRKMRIVRDHGVDVSKGRKLPWQCAFCTKELPSGKRRMLIEIGQPNVNFFRTLHVCLACVRELAGTKFVKKIYGKWEPKTKSSSSSNGGGA